MKNNTFDASKKSGENQRTIPYKIAHSWSGSREYYPNGKCIDYRIEWKI